MKSEISLDRIHDSSDLKLDPRTPDFKPL